MKKLYNLLAIMLILITVACSDKKKNDNNTNQPVTPEITVEKPVQTDIIVGENKKNIPANHPPKSYLNTMMFFMPEKPSDDVKIAGHYGIFEQPLVYKEAAYKTDLGHNIDTEVFYGKLRSMEYKIGNEEPSFEYGFKTLPVSITIGTKWTDIHVLKNNKDVKISATCTGESQYAYIFEEDGVKTPLTKEQLDQIKANFDSIYLKNREIFGLDTDTDKHSKIILLFASLDKGIYGYFNANDKYPQSKLPAMQYSNEADMLYLNIDEINNKSGIKLVSATMAHEFQHMIRHDYRKAKGLDPVIATWIDEGLSMLAEYYNGYTFRQQGLLEQFIRLAPNLSLTNWSDLNYGYSMAFFMYLNERFGKGFIKGIYDSANTGVVSVANSIKQGANFNYLYQDFVYMILVSGRNISNEARYNMKTLDIKTAIDNVYKDFMKEPDDVYTASIASGMVNPQDMHYYSFNLVRWLDMVNIFYYESAEGVQGYMRGF